MAKATESDKDSLETSWRNVVKRRSFLKNITVAGAALPAAALIGAEGNAQARSSAGTLPPGDVALLKFAAWAEIVESDLWTQYNELGGVHGGNPAYMAALQNLDSDMPQYINDNTDDELSHAAFLNAFLISRGEEPVDLDVFRTLQGSQATGAQDILRLTNLLSLNVDLSWYTRYRSRENPDLGATFKGPFTITNEPAIPLNDTDTPPDTPAIVPPLTGKETKQQLRMQAIANTAGFHFAFIEQGGSSLYPTLAFKATDPIVLRILVSIGGVEIDHFGLWHDKAGNAVSAPLAGVTDPETKLRFPNLNAPPTELTQTNKILPEPCDFLSEGLPECSVIRPTLTKLAGAVATVKAFKQDGLFRGQSAAFFELANKLAEAADAAQRQ
ncbi:MAG: twin-arginine translocation signal domain-containing protein [Acidobacteriaceae bacterium]|nr:twin-arginine translocation signal domain-containing protein [Acidobacteriaceae bacterium]